MNIETLKDGGGIQTGRGGRERFRTEILAECERGEDSAMKEYKKAMEENLASPVREIISVNMTK
jgi:hypothetical protein